jgi:hypothetical protein
MAVSDTSPNADNLYKGSGIGYFKRTGAAGYFDLGYMQLVEVTPAVEKTDKYAARGGERTKIKTFVNQTNLSFALTMMEWTAKNTSLMFGGTQAAAVNLVTTADIATNLTLNNIASITGLVHGRRYFVAGTGIAAGASFVFDSAGGGDGSDQTLDRATTATTVGLSVTITAPVAFGIFDASQVTGSFIFVGDNNVGPPVRIEALNAILTPNGTLTLLDSDSTDPGELAMTLDVYVDSFGKTAQFYWNDATAWVPVLA